MNFPHPFEWDLVQKLIKWLSPIQRVREDVVKIQKKPTVGLFDNTPDEIPISKFIPTRLEIIHTCFDCDWDLESLL